MYFEVSVNIPAPKTSHYITTLYNDCEVLWTEWTSGRADEFKLTRFDCIRVDEFYTPFAIIFIQYYTKCFALFRVLKTHPLQLY